ncbi:MAG: hypothetical protein J6V88_04005 [Kiritimatiellae bacterium]|nr:hypothetical protein [Kiritimatiellia bacterium]
MRSNVCKIEKGSKDLAAILRESEKVAVYNELTNKQTMQLRLLCEEIDGMLPEIIDEFNGELWIEFEDGVCKVNVSIEFSEFTMDKKENLIAIAKNKKNAAAVGIAGKIRSALEDLFLNDQALQSYAMSASAFHFSTGYGNIAGYSHLWSLDQYRNSIKEEQAEAWDELEKSVIASVADDITVGVKGKKADIVMVKKFVQGEE